MTSSQSHREAVRLHSWVQLCKGYRCSADSDGLPFLSVGMMRLCMCLRFWMWEEIAHQSWSRCLTLESRNIGSYCRKVGKGSQREAEKMLHWVWNTNMLWNLRGKSREGGLWAAKNNDLKAKAKCRMDVIHILRLLMQSSSILPVSWTPSKKVGHFQ